jgi:hypothetical protein
MGIDLNKDVDQISSKIEGIGTACVAKKQKKDRVKKQKKQKEDKNNTAPNKILKKTQQYWEVSKNFTKKQLEREGNAEKSIDTFIDKLIDIFKKTSSSVSKFGVGQASTIDFLLRALFFTIAKVKSLFSKILIDNVTQVLGCSEQTSYSSLVDTPFYIKVKHIDLFKYLTFGPNGEGCNSDNEFCKKGSKFLYEFKNTNIGEIPYSMDRQLYERLTSTQSFSQEYGNSYLGASGSELFDIRYTTTGSDPLGNPLPIDDYFEIKLKSLPNGANSVVNFLNDYYQSIEVLSVDYLLRNSLNKKFSWQSKALDFSSEQNVVYESFFKILQRFMGICIDNNKKIDVSGSAKLSDLDSFGDGFFEISGQQLREIEESVNQSTNGFITLQSCGTIQLPVNVQAINEVLDETLKETKDTKKIDLFLDGLKQFAADQNWSQATTSDDGTGIPPLNISLDLTSNLLSNLPMVSVQSLLSPKVLLGFFIMYRATTYTANQYNNDLFEDPKDFLKKFKNLTIPISRDVSVIFIEELFNYIKSNVKKLVECLLLDILSENKNKRIRMISSVLYILLQLGQSFVDFKNCKNVIDEILKLLNLANARQPGLFGLPSYVLQACQFLDGVSQTRALTKTIESLQKAGLPTGDNADGTPNLMNIMMDSLIGGIFDEQAENGKTEIAFPPFASFPNGFKLYGKSY